MLFVFASLPALHQKFDLPAPFVLHTDCPHYWRYHLPGFYWLLFFFCVIFSIPWCETVERLHVFFLGESEEEFSTRLANNLENLILKEGPETVIGFDLFTSSGYFSCSIFCFICCSFKVWCCYVLTFHIRLLLSLLSLSWEPEEWSLLLQPILRRLAFLPFIYPFKIFGSHIYAALKVLRSLCLFRNRVHKIPLIIGSWVTYIASLVSLLNFLSHVCVK